jgi:ubiquitin carboxyl-terminal hydrolase L3
MSFQHEIFRQCADSFTVPDSPLAKLLATCVPLSPHDRALALEDSKELEESHTDAAHQGDTAIPEGDVDFHFLCFVQSHKNGRLYELDGRKKGPVDTGRTLQGTEDVLNEEGLELVREFIRREKDGNLNFGLLALVPTQ